MSDQRLAQDFPDHISIHTAVRTDRRADSRPVSIQTLSRIAYGQVRAPAADFHGRTDQTVAKRSTRI
ncbi:MAG: hypothetical protein ACLTTP_01170 [Alistipes ihumii]